MGTTRRQFVRASYAVFLSSLVDPLVRDDPWRKAAMSLEFMKIPSKRKEPSPIPPLLLGVDEAASALRLGRTKIYGLMLDGTLPFVKIGSRRLIAVSALTSLVERLQSGEVL